MPRDPQGRPTDDGAKPVRREGRTGLTPDDISGPTQKRTSADPDWLTMTTTDPAFFLKDSNPE